MDLLIASDHGGYELKQQLIDWLNKEHNIIDLGTHNTDSVDYPVYAEKVIKVILDENHLAKRGILICGTGIGMSLVANKYKGIRAALCTNPYMAEMSRKHNHSNILVLSGRLNMKWEIIKEIVLKWLNSDFEGGRHLRRIELFNSLGE